MSRYYYSIDKCVECVERKFIFLANVKHLKNYSQNEKLFKKKKTIAMTAHSLENDKNYSLNRYLQSFAYKNYFCICHQFLAR